MDLRLCLGYIEKMNNYVASTSRLFFDRGCVCEIRDTIVGQRKITYTSEELFGDTVDLEDFQCTMSELVLKVMWKSYLNGKVPYDLHVNNPEYCNDQLKITCVNEDGSPLVVSYALEDVIKIFNEVRLDQCHLE